MWCRLHQHTICRSRPAKGEVHTSRRAKHCSCKPSIPVLPRLPVITPGILPRPPALCIALYLLQPLPIAMAMIPIIPISTWSLEVTVPLLPLPLSRVLSQG